LKIRRFGKNSLNAIILAAGHGTRLRPLTDKIPKCMVKLFGKSLLQWQIEILKDCNVTDISIVTGYYSHVINFPNIHYFRNDKFDSTNMVESLFCAKEKLQGSVIVVYGDIIYEKRVVQKLIDSYEDYSIIVDKNWEKYWRIRFENPLKDAESLSLNEDGYIKSIGQRIDNIDEVQGQYIGLMKFQGNGLNFIKRFYDKTKNESLEGTNPLNPRVSFEESFMTDFLQGLINEGCKLKPVFIENGWLELDSLHDYEIYQKMQKDHTINKLISL